MVDEFHVALAYSNIQGKYGLPAVVSGIVTEREYLDELEKRNLPSKKLLIRRKNSLYNLQSTFDDVSDYLTEYEIDKVRVRQNPQGDIERSYLKLLAILRKGHLRVISGKISSISIRCIEDPRTWKPVDFSDHFAQRIRSYSADIKTCYRNHYDRLLEIAKILARVEYERVRSIKGEYILDLVAREKDSLFQILKISWHSPPVDEYSNYEVGVPAIVVRKPNSSSIDFVYIQPNLKLSFSPIAKFCRGSRNGKEVVKCKRHTASNPFGQYLLGSSGEQCWDCRKGHEYSLCLYRKPLCNGYDVLCGKTDFAGNICCDLFALYVTRFSDELKIGTAFLPNVVGRLLGQGANSALIVYPIKGIMNVYLMEKFVKQYLQKQIHRFGQFGIKRVFRRTPPAEKKLQEFLLNWNRDDRLLMKEIDEIIAEVTFKMDGYSISLAQAHRKICNFLQNYISPPKELHVKYMKPKPLFHPVNGVVAGIRGSFLFLGSGQVVDLKKLQGYVVKGGI